MPKAKRAVLRRTVLGLGLAATMGGTAVAQDLCQVSSSATALAVRTLQSDLMVAALSCGVKGQYNAFATKFKQPLIRNGHVLRAVFDDRFGGRGTARLTTYVTEMANQAAQRMALHDGNFCAEASGLFQKVLALPPAELDGYARAHMARMNGGDNCAAERVAELALR